jgi:hypothetical protein
MNKYAFISLLGLFLLNTGNSQILNIDSELKDTMDRKRYLLISGTFSHDKQKKSINDLTSGIEFVQKLKNRYALVLVGQTNVVLSGREIIQNEGFFQWRYRDPDVRKTSIESYVQFQWNGLWGMEQRALAGANIRQRILDKKSGDFYVGMGGFYETETWNYKGVEDASKIPLKPEVVALNRFRINTYFKAAKKLFKNCDIVTESFIQANAFSLINNPSIRWFMLGKINYQLSEKFLLTFNYDHIYNQIPPVPIKRLYSGYSLELNVKL